RERDGNALPSASDRARTDKLWALLCPDAVFAGEHPYRAIGPLFVLIGPVGIPAHDCGVAISGKCDGTPLARVSTCARTDQLAPLLHPDASRATSEHPRRAEAAGIIRRSDDGGIAISRERD